ncbi:unnamed protein product [Paramecium sonneborni]|uniref:Transmembrane protein n=1 Tax=Paramecium sonneborni TaxID=65129 RepID=A0A8S1K0I1_9CILI|nr:unnamed protein product [Paramecium sonneborni]
MELNKENQKSIDIYQNENDENDLFQDQDNEKIIQRDRPTFVIQVISIILIILYVIGFVYYLISTSKDNQKSNNQ